MTDNTGTAFPAVAITSDDSLIGDVGMSLRDYFAAQVICHSYPSNLSAAELADQAYDIADAMMARRSR